MPLLLTFTLRQEFAPNPAIHSKIRAYHMAYLKCNNEEEAAAASPVRQQQTQHGSDAKPESCNGKEDGMEDDDPNANLQLSGICATNLEQEDNPSTTTPGSSQGTSSVADPTTKVFAASTGLEGGGTASPASATAASAGATRITFLYRLQEGAADASFGAF